MRAEEPTPAGVAVRVAQAMANVLRHRMLISFSAQEHPIEICVSSTG